MKSLNLKNIPVLAVIAFLVSALTSCAEEKVQITALYLDTMELYLDVGQSRQLVASVRPEDAPVTFRWFSSDESIATVSQDGLVTLVSDGTATVTAMWGSYRRSCVVSTAGIKLDRNKVFMTPGSETVLTATLQPADESAVLQWSSSDDDIAVVDEAGKVSYVSEGEAAITVSYKTYSASCMISCVGKNPWDFRNALANPLSNSLIYSKNVLLCHEYRIMQGFDIMPDGVMYYSQVSPDGKDVVICRSDGAGQSAGTQYMTMRYFGHGTQFSVERAADGDYIWLGSNGVETNGEYGDNLSFSRVKFAAGTLFEHSAGQTFFLTGTGEYDLQVSVDFESKRLLLGTRKGGNRNFRVFDLDQVMALPEKNIDVTMKVEGQTLDKTVPESRDLSECEPLAGFSIPAGVNKDTDVYSYSHQGHEVVGDYIYFYEGNAVEDGSEYYSKAYLTTFTYGGDIVVPRTEVMAVSDKADLKTFGLTDKGYAEAESLKIKNGRLYLGFACHNGPGTRRYANVLVYDGEIQ